MLGNLIDNAIDAMADPALPRRELLVEIGEDIHAFTFRVFNTGSRIPPERLGDIFERGYTTKSAGRGMGLSIVLEIMEENGGEIRASSDETGTAFLWPFAQNTPRKMRKGENEAAFALRFRPEGMLLCFFQTMLLPLISRKMALTSVTVAGMPPFLPRATMVARSLSSSRSLSCTALAKTAGRGKHTHVRHRLVHAPLDQAVDGRGRAAHHHQLQARHPPDHSPPPLPRGSRGAVPPA